ncbi:MAG: DUF975 family protein, partial [Anaerovoracaceae bacterium]
GYWKHMTIACIVYMMVVMFPYLVLMSSAANPAEIMDFANPSTDISNFNSGGGLVNLYMFIVSGPMSFGLTLMFVNLYRRKNLEMNLLFSGFKVFFNAFVLTLLVGLFTFLWSLLFIIPGIIASYRYKLAMYILVENPEKSPMECIEESKKLMAINKGKAFGLDLSYIGWMLLSMIPGIGVTAILFAGMGDSSIIMLSSQVIMIILMCPVFAYYYAGQVDFYHQALKKKFELDGIENPAQPVTQPACLPNRQVVAEKIAIASTTTEEQREVEKRNTVEEKEISKGIEERQEKKHTADVELKAELFEEEVEIETNIFEPEAIAEKKPAKKKPAVKKSLPAGRQAKKETAKKKPAAKKETATKKTATKSKKDKE